MYDNLHQGPSQHSYHRRRAFTYAGVTFSPFFRPCSEEIKDADVTSKHRKRYYYEYGKLDDGKKEKKSGMTKSALGGAA